MIYRENKQQKFFTESDSLNSPVDYEDTPYNGVYCLRRIKQGKNVLFFYLYQNSSKQTV